jgi:hypothetical protein
LGELIRGMQEKQIDLSDGRLDHVMRRLKEDRAMGDDAIPSEFFEAVCEARQELYAIIRKVFKGEVPAALVVVIFAMIYNTTKGHRMGPWMNSKLIGQLV